MDDLHKQSSYVIRHSSILYKLTMEIKCCLYYLNMLEQPRLHFKKKKTNKNIR